jgi:GT2 family glycosyltransferase
MITVIIPTTKERRERLDECVNAVKDNAGIPHRILIYENNDGGCVLAMHNAVKDINGLIFIINDDMIMEKDCLKILMDNYDNNFLYPDDGIQKGKFACSFFCDADYFRKHLHLGYTHNYVDNELTEIARMQGKLKYVPEAKLIHKHWTRGVAKDKTYGLQDTTKEKDKKLYEERLAVGFNLTPPKEN